ncbi:MAG: class I SAM-dependent methyltransferase [Endomicrobiia bacterium]
MINFNNFEYIVCNICGIDDTVKLLEYDAETVVKCRKCGLIYKNPRSPQKEFKKFFEAFSVENEESFIFSKKYLFIKIINKIQKIKKKGRILDIGCGNGYFLKIAKDFGWDVYGVEINPSAIKLAREKFGIQVEQKNLIEIKDEEFDVITLIDVLDFFMDPKKEIKEIKRILKKDGILIVRVRNGLWHCNLGKYKKFFKFFGLYPSVVHLYSFTPKTLKKLLQNVGFSDIKILNSSFTKGDPYKTGYKIVIIFAKFLVSFISQILYFLSFKKICIAPSIMAYVKKN